MLVVLKDLYLHYFLPQAYDGASVLSGERTGSLIRMFEKIGDIPCMSTVSKIISCI